MENKKVIILGSSRKNGNTTRIVDEISKETEIDVINLSDYNISYYDYESKNREDDFFPLIKGIIENYDTLIFATPIYWYNMSGIMKVFFDRISDLIRIEKETGRKLRGKKIGVISNSHDNQIEDSFYIPFIKSADYLGLEYLGHSHFNANILNQTTKIELTFI
ncbi:flavodoxin family protein [Flavobacterium hercynium]|uniref:FMN reductase n=1 Tax=Flavobacterium hercynium TaxID=387094 RepID=A0A226GR82_9FLAO|nr:NAD(P)H-dependent oxidoreductase [Flavobacterium hercynium]OXA84058.1 FMN reductase [Flavobacterium hercynium]SMP37078.1 NADPH-dependent FMN reductase [Flavobacterium hercynium]